MLTDYAIRAVTEDAFLRAIVSKTTNLADKARQKHHTYPTATAALGRLLTGAAMLGMTLKGDERLSLMIKGDGPLGQLLAVSRSNGFVKGYVAEPQTHLPLNSQGKLDVGKAVGEGMLYITKDLGLKEPYRGSSPLITGEIAEDLTNYFAVSEQTPSAIALGVLVDVDNSVKAAGGFLVQLMPGAPDSLVEKLEQNLAHIKSVSDHFAQGKTPEELLAVVFNGLDHQILERQELKFLCDCSRSSMERVLLSLGEEELISLKEEQKGAEIRCHYCNRAYQFSEQELTDLAKQVSKRKE
ncbi:MAG: Hsp33 family molecular chaperone HslO [Bacillota bacterium]